MKDLETIAQLLLSPEQPSKEIGLFLIKSQRIKIDSLYNHIAKQSFSIIYNYLNNTSFPRVEKMEVKRINLSVFGVLIHARIAMYNYVDLAYSYKMEVWDMNVEYMVFEGNPETSIKRSKIYRAVEKFTQLVVENLKTL